MVPFKWLIWTLIIILTLKLMWDPTLTALLSDLGLISLIIHQPIVWLTLISLCIPKLLTHIPCSSKFGLSTERSNEWDWICTNPVLFFIFLLRLSISIALFERDKFASSSKDSEIFSNTPYIHLKFALPHIKNMIWDKCVFLCLLSSQFALRIRNYFWEECLRMANTNIFQ